MKCKTEEHHQGFLAYVKTSKQTKSNTINQVKDYMLVAQGKKKKKLVGIK